MNGRDYYAAIYASQLDAEAKWLAFGAVEKANSVQCLVREKPESVMELGAGTGALTAELQRRKFSDRYVAVDYSPDACRYMRAHLDGVEIYEADIAQTIPAAAQVVVASHVVEHLERPDDFLSPLAKFNFDWLVLECPMEDLAASRAKNLFRDRTRNLAGHVQFFTPRTFRALAARHFDVVDDRWYAPWQPSEVVRFIADKDGLSPHIAAIKHVTMHYAPRLLEPLWKRLWLGNYALLCRHR
jgi:SAM-dependent methyltransferase